VLEVLELVFEVRLDVELVEVSVEVELTDVADVLEDCVVEVVNVCVAVLDVDEVNETVDEVLLLDMVLLLLLVLLLERVDEELIEVLVRLKEVDVDHVADIELEVEVNATVEDVEDVEEVEEIADEEDVEVEMAVDDVVVFPLRDVEDNGNVEVEVEECDDDDDTKVEDDDVVNEVEVENDSVLDVVVTRMPASVLESTNRVTENSPVSYFWKQFPSS